MFVATVISIFLNGCSVRPGPVKNTENPPAETEESATDGGDNDTEDTSSTGSGFFSNINDHEKPPHQEVPEISNEPSENEISDDATQEAKALLGKWASHSYGEINGQGTSDDELITFMKNGTFTDVIVMSGPLMEGTLNIKGKFSADKNTILFYDCTESWDPAPGSSTEKEAYKNKAIDDYENEYAFIDGETIDMSYLTYERVD